MAMFTPTTYYDAWTLNEAMEVFDTLVRASNIQHCDWAEYQIHL